MNVIDIFSIQIFFIDYYLSKPIFEIDNNYSALAKQFVDKLPVIRIFGTTQSGWCF